MICKDASNPELFSNYRLIALCNAFYQLVNIINTSRLKGLVERYSILKSSQLQFRNSKAVQLGIQKANWLIREAMKNDGTLIRVDLDFKNAFNLQAIHACGRSWRGSVFQMSGYSRTSTRTLLCGCRLVGKAQQPSSWIREQSRVQLSPRSCLICLSMPSFDC